MATDNHTRIPQHATRRHFLAAVSATALRAATLTGAVSVFGVGKAKAKRVSPSYKGNPRGGGSGGGGGGDDIGQTKCFAGGTRILTGRGNVPVEDIEIGDTVCTVSGRQVPVRWVGMQAFADGPVLRGADVMPIRIEHDAIAEGVPLRDLYVSPWHFLFFDGYLMPAKDLVNGASITQTLPAGAKGIEYYHIVLDHHDVVLAEGVAAETLLMTAGAIEIFSNSAEYVSLYGEHPPSEHVPYAPRVWYSGGRSHLVAMLRSGVSHVVDIRDPIQCVYDRLATRVTNHPVELAA